MGCISSKPLTSQENYYADRSNATPNPRESGQSRSAADRTPSVPHGLLARTSQSNQAGNLAGRAGLDLLRSLSGNSLEREKQALISRVESEGANFRITPEERADFKSAWLSMHSRDYPSPEASWTRSTEYMDSLKRDHPELQNMHAAELLAIREWTGDDYKTLRDVFEHGSVVTAEALAWAKALISALHSLPGSYNHHGTVYTGRNETQDWARSNCRAGQRTVNRRFFSSSAANFGAFDFPVSFQTKSRNGKRISLFSYQRSEAEVLFPPGTKFQVSEVVHRPDGRSVVHQREVG
ncbi:type III secretion system effector XopAI [Collimonas pratensis]|uniref:NAD(+)--protein-arginine ADP-ribosyltransferase n=1 Tax=Collimonas pratensis TaxID=279113 RepID=A0A127QAF8_9BURK|nr:type III secretion system effector XopAI [Collimonas pratensis]AMP07049.1 NAD:arginine ADP-ribosyltransferase family protein [Collimonas pratensis]